MVRIDALDRWVIDTFVCGVERIADILLAHGATDDQAEALEVAHDIRLGMVEEILRMLSEDEEERR